jgi:hypothetical protein
MLPHLLRLKSGIFSDNVLLGFQSRYAVPAKFSHF